MSTKSTSNEMPTIEKRFAGEMVKAGWANCSATGGIKGLAGNPYIPATYCGEKPQLGTSSDSDSVVH